VKNLKNGLIRFFKLVFFGLAVTVLNILLTSFLTEIIKLYYLHSYIIALTLTTAVNFVINTKLIFKTQQKHFKRFIFYVIGLAVFYVSDIILTRTFTDLVGFHYAISILFSKTILFFVKFAVYDKLLFRDSSIMFR
jgi:putative flippase GtrA